MRRREARGRSGSRQAHRAPEMAQRPLGGPAGRRGHRPADRRATTASARPQTPGRASAERTPRPASGGTCSSTCSPQVEPRRQDHRGPGAVTAGHNDGAIVLSGNRPHPRQARARPATKVIIDLKSGFPAPAHRDDLRFYALLETLRLGVPPRLLARLPRRRPGPAEAVTVPLLEAALAAVIDGIHKMVSLANGREPTLVPGPSCRCCRLAGHRGGGPEAGATWETADD